MSGLRILGLAAVGLACGSGVACNPISAAYFLFRGDSKAPAEHPLPPKEGQKDISVAILVSCPNAGFDFAGIDRELAAAVARRLFDQTKSGKHPIRAVENAKLDKFKASNPDWRSVGSAELGKQVGADYVIDLTLASIDLYEPGTGRLMYMGTATVEGSVYESSSGTQQAHYFVNPKLESRPSSDLLKAQYRAKLLERVADEITWKHVAHANDQQITPAAR